MKGSAFPAVMAPQPLARWLTGSMEDKPERLAGLPWKGMRT